MTSELLGVGVVGTGWVSGEHARAFRGNPHTEIRAVVSRERSRAEAWARKHGIENCRPCTSVAEMLRDDAIRIVSICTPHHLHAEQGIEAAEAGRHVLVEKPVALDLASLHALAGAVSRAGVKSVVSFVLRWNPLFENIKAQLAQGLAGELFYAEVDYLHAIGPDYAGHAWITQKRYGGNALLTAGCHAVDALRWFVGAEAVEVSAYANRSRSNPMSFGYEPNSVTIVKFANGAMGKVATSLESVGPYTFNIALYGDRGTIRNNQVFTRCWPGQKGWATVPTILPDTADVAHHPFAGEINHLVQCILEDRKSHCNLADAVKTHEICLASEVSAVEGRPVRLPLK
ncbi:MAG: Gfo/Idh/MocA family oxidoreductase [Bryobacteraceae bacterium]|jgi:predicted dehydrogenase